MSEAIAGIPSGPTLATVWASTMTARITQRRAGGRPAVDAEHDLVHARAGDLLGRRDDAQRADLRVPRVPERLHEARDVARRDERLVALDVDVHVGRPA